MQSSSAFDRHMYWQAAQNVKQNVHMWPKTKRTEHIAGPVCVCVYQQQSVCDAQQALYSSRGPAELWGLVCLLRPWTPRRHPGAQHTHTPANTYAQTTPCPLTPTPPHRPFLLGKPSLYTWSLCRGCMRAVLWITSGPAARVCHLARQHDPSCQSCFIIVTFSYSLAKWREGPGQVTRTQTHTHAYTVSALFISSDVDRCLSVLR